jgi:phosphotransferase system HPr (HPr) family protein
MSARTVIAAQALHARPASAVAATAGAFDADVTVSRGDREANAKSVIAVLALDVAAGNEVLVRAEGDDARAAVAAVAEAIARG